jgi:ribonuclease VapC
MVTDTSALVAIFAGEPEADLFDATIVREKVRLLPATCLLGARMVLVARRDERSMNDLDLWLYKAGIDVVAIDCELINIATQSLLVYGKGRHPAWLNFADCISYAVSRRLGEPLLFKGNDFPQTDIQAPQL